MNDLTRTVARLRAQPRWEMATATMTWWADDQHVATATAAPILWWSPDDAAATWAAERPELLPTGVVPPPAGAHVLQPVDQDAVHQLVAAAAREARHEVITTVLHGHGVLFVALTGAELHVPPASELTEDQVLTNLLALATGDPEGLAAAAAGLAPQLDRDVAVADPANPAAGLARGLAGLLRDLEPRIVDDPADAAARLQEVHGRLLTRLRDTRAMATPEALITALAQWIAAGEGEGPLRDELVARLTTWDQALAAGLLALGADKGLEPEILVGPLVRLAALADDPGAALAPLAAVVPEGATAARTLLGR